jgi:hypothetical protein
MRAAFGFMPLPCLRLDRSSIDLQSMSNSAMCLWLEVQKVQQCNSAKGHATAPPHLRSMRSATAQRRHHAFGISCNSAAAMPSASPKRNSTTAPPPCLWLNNSTTAPPSAPGNSEAQQHRRHAFGLIDRHEKRNSAGAKESHLRLDEASKSMQWTVPLMPQRCHHVRSIDRSLSQPNVQRKNDEEHHATVPLATTVNASSYSDKQSLWHGPQVVFSLAAGRLHVTWVHRCNSAPFLQHVFTLRGYFVHSSAHLPMAP